MTIFEDLIPDPLPAGVKVLYGTVTGSSPLRVQVDGDPGPLPVTPTTTVACAVGDRVVMLSHVRADNPDARARAVVIIGVIGGGDTGWVAATQGTGYTTYGTVESRVIAGVCYVRGLIRPNSGTIASGVVAAVATLPTSHRPDQSIYVPADSWVAGASVEHVGYAGIQINTSGVLTVYAARESSGVRADGITFLVA